MKRAAHVLIALGVLTAWPMDRAACQNSQSAAVTIQVGVADGLSVLWDRDLNFGNVVVGTGQNQVALASPNAGKLHIVGGQNRQVQVTLTPPSQLTYGTNSIPYTWGAAYNEQLDNPADPTTVTVAGTTASFRLRDNTIWKNNGQAYMWLFGSVNVGSVPPGTYTGTFTVSAAY